MAAPELMGNPVQSAERRTRNRSVQVYLQGGQNLEEVHRQLESRARWEEARADGGRKERWSRQR